MAAPMGAVGPKGSYGHCVLEKNQSLHKRDQQKRLHRHSMLESVCRFDGSAYLNTATAEAERALGALLAACRR